MTIQVTKTQLASPDGIQTINYQAGQQYEMPEPLAEVFVDQGWGTAASAEDPEEPDILEEIDGDPAVEPAQQPKPETTRQPKKQYK